MKRINADKKYQWDFSKLYKNNDEWKKQLTQLNNQTKMIVELKGKLNIKENFIKYLEIYEEINNVCSKLNQYLHLSDIDTTNLEYQQLAGLYENFSNDFSTLTAFIAPEFKKIGEKQILDWLENETNLHRHIYGFVKFFRNNKYIFDEKSEELLSSVERTRSAAYSLYDLLAYADRSPLFVKKDGEEKELTTTLYTDIMKNSKPIEDQNFRLETAKKYTQQLVEKKHSFAKVYESILQYSVEEVKIRGYDSTLKRSLLSDNVDPKVYENLIDVGKKNASLVSEYFLIIKNHFKFDKFYGSDGSLKLTDDFDGKFSVEQAKDIIRKALNCLGKEYLDNTEIAWAENRIDYYEDTNKRTGAYSSGGGKVEPIILMNWDDTIGSVNTLAHEIGHSVHTLFADAAQPYPLSHYPIILAEVASTVNEHLLFDHLYQNANSKEMQIYLLQNRISEIIGTFFRQIQFADFELQAHKLVETPTPLNSDILADLFNDIANQFGLNIFDEREDKKQTYYSWVRISHFFHSPFYVYKYAACIVASFKLYQDIKNNNTSSLINFLKAAGHKDPLEILKDVGVDYTDENVYTPLLTTLKEMIDQLKTLLNG